MRIVILAGEIIRSFARKIPDSVDALLEIDYDQFFDAGRKIYCSLNLKHTIVNRPFIGS